MRKLIIIALALLFSCVSVRVQTGEKNTSDKEDSKELTGVDVDGQ